MSNVHIYTAVLQPATRYVIDLGEKESMTLTLKPRRLVRCRRCERLRYAANCVVQVYYDDHYFSCADRARCTKRKRGRRKKR